MERFAKVYVEITNRCNLACDFCPPTRRAAAFMPPEQFSTILDQIKPYTSHIYLHIKGEPLLHPALGELLDISDAKGFRVNITTNGTLIRRVHEMLLTKPAVRQINFSLHSFEGNESGGSREAYIRDILDFTRDAQQRSIIIVSLRLWNLDGDGSFADQPKMSAAARRNDALLSMIEETFDLPYSIADQVISARGIAIADRVFLHQEHLFAWPDMSAEEIPGDAFCYGLRNQIGILVDGTVVPCCLDGEGVICLGNIFEKPFGEIIAGPRTRAIYDGFSRREAVEDLCKRCGYRQRFSK